MNKIQDADFMTKFPPALKKDKTMLALGQIIAEELHLTANEIKKNIIYANIEGLSEKWLDVLAYDLHVDWYDYDYPIEIKRAIIKDSVKVHKKFGTKYAVETALRNIYKDAKISEWFEYGGRPFCFRATIGIEVSQEEVNGFLKCLKVVKNIRSWLDAIIYTMIIDHRNLEGIVLENVLSRMAVSFWGVDLFDGSLLFDGTAAFNGKRRYGLVLKLNSRYRIFNSLEKTALAFVDIIQVKNYGNFTARNINIFGINFRGSYGLVSCICHMFKIPGRKESINLYTAARMKQYTGGNMAVGAGYHIKAAFWKTLHPGLYLSGVTRCKTKVSFKVRLEADLTGCEKIDNVLVETRTPDYCFFDGTVLFDGTRKFNSVYKKEAAE